MTVTDRDARSASRQAASANRNADAHAAVVAQLAAGIEDLLPLTAAMPPAAVEHDPDRVASLRIRTNHGSNDPTQPRKVFIVLQFLVCGVQKAIRRVQSSTR